MAFLAVIYRKNVSFRASVNASFFQVKFTATKKNCNTTLLQARPLKNLTFNYIILYKNLFSSTYYSTLPLWNILICLFCVKKILFGNLSHRKSRKKSIIYEMRNSSSSTSEKVDVFDEKKKLTQIFILYWYEIIKLSRVVHMCTNSSISAATRTQIFGHPGLNGLCLYYRKSTKIPHVSPLCRKGIGQMDFFGCIFCVQILTYICRSIFPKRKNERRIWHCLS